MPNIVAMKEIFEFIRSKLASFSDTIWSGRPNLEKILQRAVMVVVLIAFFIGITSGHLLCASTTTKNILFRKGPEKSM